MSEATADQRIFSLILALLTTGDRGSTKHVLLSTVYGYAETYRWGGDNSSLERKFERDKDQLRDLGIPLETYTPFDSSGNNQDTHYRIAKDLLQIPESVIFSEQELQMLNAAALVWQEGSLSVESRRALMKLGSMAESVVTEPIAVKAEITMSEPSVIPIRRAMTAGRDVSFSYRKPGKRRQTRRVASLRLHRADGRWYLIAFDYARDAYRSFLLSRIVGDVTLEDTSFDEAHKGEAERVERELTQLQSEQVAVIRVTPGSRADYALSPRSTRSQDDEELLFIATLDYAALAEDILGYGDDIEAVSPKALIDHLGRLSADIAKLHRGVKH